MTRPSFTVEGLVMVLSSADFGDVESVRFDITGEPHACNGHRVSASKHVYNPQSRFIAALKRDLKKELAAWQAPCPLLGGRLKVVLTFRLRPS